MRNKRFLLSLTKKRLCETFWYMTTHNFGYIVLNEQLENAALVGKRSKEHQVGNC